MRSITCKKCRRLGQSVCGRENCAIKRKPYPPGIQPKRRTRVSEYGRQLLEKQKLKLLYGVQEKQFRNYFQKASAKRELTGPTLLVLLEQRLDNVIYRLGFGTTRRQARQLVSHGHFTVNDRKVTIPSYQVRPGDIIIPRQGSREIKIFDDLQLRLKKYEPPSWLKLDKEKLEGRVVAMPGGEALQDIPVEIAQIVEFYSR